MTTKDRGNWTFYAVETATGQMITELPLADFKGAVELTSVGSMSANLHLSHIEDASQRQQLLDATRPGRTSIVADRDGVVVGEWIIWARQRSQTGPVQLSGSELLSIMDYRVMWNWSWTQIDQLQIANDIVVEAFKGWYLFPGTGGQVELKVAPWTPSGQLRDRAFKVLDGNMGTRLRELSQVENGFDYWINTAWDTTSNALKVVRFMQFAYPRAGIDQPVTFDLGGDYQPGGNVIGAQLVEDATTLAGRAFSIGATVDDVLLWGIKESSALTDAGYPRMERAGSWTSVIEQPTLNGYAAALLDRSQDPSEPVALTVLADLDPKFGQYALGDRVYVHIDPSGNFPVGFDQQVRILGWSLSPTITAPEQVQLHITSSLAGNT